MGRVKICGITNLTDALFAEAVGASVLGFVFYEKSPRYISPKAAKAIISKLSVFTLSAGIFVNQKTSEVKKIAKFCNLDVLQFHGDETPKYCAQFKQYRTVKAFRISTKEDLVNIKKYDTDAILLDAYSKGFFGGTGKRFNWQIVKKLKINKPIILSGGLTPENVAGAIKLTNASIVDVSSGVEKSYRLKDHRKIADFIKRANR
ncbi:MAG TPA: phosphoribosylanthranilate isomerase [Candidatus Omnitrophica bacterium]|nr:phosphoribosylanthranilate isomerase [Candidatus Omnitrophota bacterium]